MEMAKPKNSLHIQTTRCRGRKGWELDNGVLTLVMLQGGGHFASITLKDLPRVNPFWAPEWKGLEPWQYKAGDAKRFESKLLASICGHNLCLGWFGDPSPAEARLGLGTHGEAPVASWRLVRKTVTKKSVTLVCECDLQIAMTRLKRTVHMVRGSYCVTVREEIVNLASRDLPFTMCEHVTFGPPFLAKGETLFDMSATKGHTYPGIFGTPQRLKSDTSFCWPRGPGVNGKPVDLRMIGRDDKHSSDYSAQLMDPSSRMAWFSAVNPNLGLLVAYFWNRADFPWVGNWEENFARKESPWRGRSLTRGMEFANTPFPEGLQKAVERGDFHGIPTFRWIPARGRFVMDYGIVMKRVDVACKGVETIISKGDHVELRLR